MHICAIHKSCHTRKYIFIVTFYMFLAYPFLNQYVHFCENYWHCGLWDANVEVKPLPFLVAFFCKESNASFEIRKLLLNLLRRYNNIVKISKWQHCNVSTYFTNGSSKELDRSLMCRRIKATFELSPRLKKQFIATEHSYFYICILTTDAYCVCLYIFIFTNLSCKYYVVIFNYFIPIYCLHMFVNIEFISVPMYTRLYRNQYPPAPVSIKSCQWICHIVAHMASILFLWKEGPREEEEVIHFLILRI